VKKNINNIDIVAALLRAGLVLVFLYAAISSLQHPLEWEGFLPNFLTQSLSANTLIKLFALYELVLVVWLVSGRYIRYCALLCTITLLGIVVTNPSQLITTFRDVGLACMSLALYFEQQK
jgi:hypothetical protein